MTHERRTATRIPFSVEAVVRYDGRPITGVLLNISLCGLFIEIHEQLPLHAPIDIEVVLESGAERIRFVHAGEVVRSRPGGAAVRLTKMDLDSYIAVRDLMMANAQDPEALMREFHKFIMDNRVDPRAVHSTVSRDPSE